MATNIKNKSLGKILLQSGNGIPTHSAPKSSKYIDIDSGLQYINLDGSTSWDLITPDYLPSFSLTSGSTYSVGTSMAMIGFQQQNFKNPSDNSIFEYIDEYTIKINDIGLYKISYNLNDSSGGGVMNVWYTLNGITIDGSTTVGNFYNGEEHILSQEFIVNITDITSDQLLRMYAQKSSGGTDTIDVNSSLNITKISLIKGAQGDKGDKGDNGSGSTIIIQKDDITVGTQTSTLNFEGNNVTTTDEGSGKTTIDIKPYYKGEIQIETAGASVQNLNTNNGIDIEFPTAFYIDNNYFTKLSNTEIRIEQSGIYEISYKIDGKNANTARTTVLLIIFQNSTKIDKTASYGYTRTSGGGDMTVLVSPVSLSLNSGDIIKLNSSAANGTSATVNTYPSTGWLIIKNKS